MSRVFISYAREDQRVALRLAEDLRTEGYDIWIDIASLKPGDNWRLEITTAIRNSDYFVVVQSHTSITKKGHFATEIHEALAYADELPEGTRFLIPVRIENCPVSHPELERLQWVDLFPRYEPGLAQLISTLRSGDNNLKSRRQIMTMNPAVVIFNPVNYLVRYLRILGSLITEPKAFLARHNQASSMNLNASLGFMMIAVIPYATFNALFPLDAKDIIYHFMGYIFINLLLAIASASVLQFAWRLVGSREVWRRYAIITFYYCGAVFILAFIMVLLVVGFLKIVDKHMLIILRDAAGGNIKQLLNSRPFKNRGLVGAAIILVIENILLGIWTFLFWGSYRELNRSTKVRSFIAWAVASILLIPVGLLAGLLQQAIFNNLPPIK